VSAMPEGCGLAYEFSVDTGFQAFLLGRGVISLPWLDPDEVLDISTRAATTVASLVGAAESGFSGPIHADLDFSGFRMSVVLPDLSDVR